MFQNKLFWEVCRAYVERADWRRNTVLELESELRCVEIGLFLDLPWIFGMLFISLHCSVSSVNWSGNSSLFLYLASLDCPVFAACVSLSFESSCYSRDLISAEMCEDSCEAKSFTFMTF